MPDYQVLSDPTAPYDSGRNPYLTKHYKKDATIRRRRRRIQRGSVASPPLMRDLLIMKEGMESIKGYDQLAPDRGGEFEGETAESNIFVHPEIAMERPDVIDEGEKMPMPTEDPDPPARRGADFTGNPRGRRRGRSFNPQELELLRRAMLLIQQQGN